MWEHFHLFDILTPPGISAKRLACSDGELRIKFVMTQKSGNSGLL
jgi:hypothetical protein